MNATMDITLMPPAKLAWHVTLHASPALVQLLQTALPVPLAKEWAPPNAKHALKTARLAQPLPLHVKNAISDSVLFRLTASAEAVS